MQRIEQSAKGANPIQIGHVTGNVTIVSSEASTRTEPELQDVLSVHQLEGWLRDVEAALWRTRWLLWRWPFVGIAWALVSGALNLYLVLFAQASGVWLLTMPVFALPVLYIAWRSDRQRSIYGYVVRDLLADRDKVARALAVRRLGEDSISGYAIR